MNRIRSDHQPYFQAFPKPPHMSSTIYNVGHISLLSFLLASKIRLVLGHIPSEHVADSSANLAVAQIANFDGLFLRLKEFVGPGFSA